MTMHLLFIAIITTKLMHTVPVDIEKTNDVNLPYSIGILLAWKNNGVNAFTPGVSSSLNTCKSRD